MNKTNNQSHQCQALPKWICAFGTLTNASKISRLVLALSIRLCIGIDLNQQFLFRNSMAMNTSGVVAECQRWSYWYTWSHSWSTQTSSIAESRYNRLIAANWPSNFKDGITADFNELVKAMANTGSSLMRNLVQNKQVICDELFAV